MTIRPVAIPSRWVVACLFALIWFTIGLQLLVAAAQGQTLRLGDMRVDWYCLQRGNGAWVINNGADWACTTSSGAVAQVLSPSDYNATCQGFYSNVAAFAVKDRTSAVPALDWSCVVLIPPTPTATPLPIATRLGEFRVEWYCNELGLGVRLINNQSDWACTQANSDQILFILGQNDFNKICQRTYNNPDAYALRDQTKPEAAYNWSCYVNSSVSVTPIPLPTLTPTRAPQVTRLGEFQVEWYCTERGYGVQVINNQSDWACTLPGSNQTAFILTQMDFDQICRRTFNDQAAFALRDQNKPQPAYNWSCYVYR